MRNILILSLVVLSFIGCNRYEYDAAADRCRDTVNGQFVHMEKCAKLIGP
jgi:hypothetical protein